ncbi:MAG TPA: VanZ family protein [Spongiibacteraceae bacterium]|nr:VanZ family protein [Spongiibacteraceae bacterium]
MTDAGSTSIRLAQLLQQLPQWLRWTSWLTLLVVTYLALVPGGPSLPQLPSDKMEHALAFFTLLALFDLAYPARSLWRLKIPALLAYGVLIEVGQSVSPGRYPELMDVVADAAGIIAYLPVRWLLRRYLLPAFRPALAGIRSGGPRQS